MGRLVSDNLAMIDQDKIGFPPHITTETIFCIHRSTDCPSKFGRLILHVPPSRFLKLIARRFGVKERLGKQGFHDFLVVLWLWTVISSGNLLRGQPSRTSSEHEGKNHGEDD